MTPEKQLKQVALRIHEALAYQNAVTGWVKERVVPGIVGVLMQYLIVPPKEHWGIYCPQHNLWLCRSHGEPLTFPAREVAESFHSMYADFPWTDNWVHGHLWVVEQYGEQKHIDPLKLPAGSPLCAGPQLNGCFYLGKGL